MPTYQSFFKPCRYPMFESIDICAINLDIPKNAIYSLLLVCCSNEDQDQPSGQCVVFEASLLDPLKTTTLSSKSWICAALNTCRCCKFFSRKCDNSSLCFKKQLRAIRINYLGRPTQCLECLMCFPYFSFLKIK